MAAETGRKDVFPWMLTFERLLSQTPFVADMREMLATLEEAYGYPVDIEFTANFLDRRRLQDQPGPVPAAAGARAGGEVADLPASIDREDLILEARGAVIGQSRAVTIDRLIYVVPSVYGQLPINGALRGRPADRPADARRGGAPAGARSCCWGPAAGARPRRRWACRSPSPRSTRVSVLCEIVAMREDLVPDVSLGTHFFNELVEMDMLYLALFPGREGNLLNEEFFEQAPTGWPTRARSRRTGPTWSGSSTRPTWAAHGRSSSTPTASLSRWSATEPASGERYRRKAEGGRLKAERPVKRSVAAPPRLHPSILRTLNPLDRRTGGPASKRGGTAGHVHAARQPLETSIRPGPGRSSRRRP